MAQITIKQGISESGKIEGLPELSTGDSWNVCLINPSTKEKYDASCTLSEDGVLSFSFTGEQTLGMTVGTYNFEVYNESKSVMFSQDALYVVKSSNISLNNNTNGSTGSTS